MSTNSVSVVAHVDAAPHDGASLARLVKLINSKEEFLFKAYGERYLTRLHVQPADVHIGLLQQSGRSDRVSEGAIGRFYSSTEEMAL